MSFYVRDFGEDTERLVNEAFEEDCCQCECEEQYDCDFSDMIQALKSNNNLVAIREDGKMYEYCDCLLEINKDDNKEWIPRIIPKVNYDLVSSMYLVTPREQWCEITSQEVLEMIADNTVDNTDKFRIVSSVGSAIDLSVSAIKMLTLREILDYNWQILIKIDLD